MLFRFVIAIRATALASLLIALSSYSPAGYTQDILSGGPALAPTRLELYAGYNYFHPLGGTIATRPYATIQPGVIGSASGYLNRSFGVQLEGAASPKGPNDSIYTLEAGPVVRYSYGRFVPFAHALGGVARVRGPVQQPPTYGWGLTGGVGFDYVLPYFRRQIAVRPIQAEYEFTHIDYGPLAANGQTGGLGEIKAFRVSAGLVLRFGGSLPRERPLVYACSASPSQVFAGDPVTVTGSSTGPITRNRSVYTWEVSGGRVTVNDDSATISTAGLAPGTYAISGHLSQGRGAEENATCTESFTVMAPIPPTISCAANPLSVRPGGRVAITAIADSVQHRPLSFSYTSSAGQISNSTSFATLDTRDVQPGPINVDCRVSDDLGQVARATALVNVSAPPAPVAARRSLCGLSFERDRKRPVRVDNEAKACLDEIALTINREAGARLAITGENSKDETAGQAAARASNARIYLTQEKGIDPSRIDVKTGTRASRTAEIELIPVGTPVRYTDAPYSAAPAAPEMPVRPVGDDDSLPSPAQSSTPGLLLPPAYDGPGTIGPRRSADSLVLPPLPDDATPGRSRRARHRSAAKLRRRKAAASSGPATGTGSKPSAAVGGANP